MRKVRKLFMSGKRQQGVGGFNPAAAFDAPSSGKRRRRRRKVSRTKYRETVKSGALSLVKFIPYLLIATAAASLPLAGYKLYVYFLSSPYFALRQIEVQGVERLSSDLIVRATGLSAGANVLAIDEDGAREKLEALAWIRRADVSRELPDRVVITVVERHPAAILVEENSWLVDTEGNPFKELAQSDYDPSLLVLAGVEVSRLHRAGRGERAREMLGEALAIAKDYMPWVWTGAAALPAWITTTSWATRWFLRSSNASYSDSGISRRSCTVCRWCWKTFPAGTRGWRWCAWITRSSRGRWPRPGPAWSSARGRCPSPCPPWDGSCCHEQPKWNEMQ